MAGLIGQRLGQYEIVALLGRGGMATVYRARQLNIKREVAIKVIRADLAETADFIKRFEREAETIASLRHPYILKLFDYGEFGDTVYLVMELVSGGSLAELISKGPLPVATASRLLEQIASALDYSHERGIIHRDLKPQNVLLDEQNNPILTDFGIAKILSQTTSLTQSGMAMGTPSYMSPEQWMGKALDSRADIYALGIMLFEMLSGQLPFRAETPYSMMHMHVNEQPPPVREQRAELPPGIDQIISKALAKDPDKRYASAGALAEAFKSALTNTTGSRARSEVEEATLVDVPAPSLELIKAPARRQMPLPLIIAAGVVAVVLIGGIIAIFAGGRPQPTPIVTAVVEAPTQQVGALPNSTP